LRERLGEGGALTKAVVELEREVTDLEGSGGGRGRASSADERGGISLLNRQFLQLLELVDGADADPTPRAAAAADETGRSLARLLKRWDGLQERAVPALNAELRKAGLPIISLERCAPAPVPKD
jgi:hypothetical protein